MLKFIAEEKERLDKYLATQIAGVSRSKIQKAIKDGLVLVNGKKTLETDFQVKNNDQIELPEFIEEKLENLDLDLKIIFENSDLVVIDKPAGLVVHPAARHKKDTLVNILISKYPSIQNIGDSHRPGIVHRLDEDTSGLIVAAKNQKTFDYLKKLFQTRAIQKEYLALVHGVPANMHGEINEPIGRSSTHLKMRVGIGREAKTEYRVIANDPSLQYSLLRIKLHTGRTHQIRVHLSHLGHPVVGDQLYGGAFKAQDLQLLSRQFLHAYRLKFQLADGSWIELFSDLPAELQNILKQANINYDQNI
jgi:23S rRNA pseudouridine1911/1915/1917 synthase